MLLTFHTLHVYVFWVGGVVKSYKKYSHALLVEESLQTGDFLLLDWGLLVIRAMQDTLGKNKTSFK